MVPDRRPEVKNANGVNILEGAPLKKNDSRCGGVEKNKNVYWHGHGSKKKNERRNAWECRFLGIEEVPSENNENAKK